MTISLRPHCRQAESTRFATHRNTSCHDNFVAATLPLVELNAQFSRHTHTHKKKKKTSFHDNFVAVTLPPGVVELKAHFLRQASNTSFHLFATHKNTSFHDNFVAGTLPPGVVELKTTHKNTSFHDNFVAATLPPGVVELKAHFSRHT